MIGMLQILTYLLAFYLVMKGVEVLQLALTSSRERRGVAMLIGWVALAACIVAAFGFVTEQDQQATHVSLSMPR